MSKPLIDEWHDRLLLELRLREVPGRRIGDALAEVDAHCAASGETPEEAFGDPERYAASVAEALGTPAPRTARTGLLAGATTAAAVALLEGASGLATGEPARVLAGTPVLVAAVTLGGLAAFRCATARGRGRWLFALAAVGLVTLGAAAPLLLDRVLLTVPAVLALLLGLAGVAAVWWPRRGDLVLDPRTGRQPFATPWWATAATWLPLGVLIAAVVALGVAARLG